MHRRFLITFITLISLGVYACKTGKNAAQSSLSSGLYLCCRGAVNLKLESDGKCTKTMSAHGATDEVTGQKVMIGTYKEEKNEIIATFTEELVDKQGVKETQKLASALVEKFTKGVAGDGSQTPQLTPQQGENRTPLWKQGQ